LFAFVQLSWIQCAQSRIKENHKKRINLLKLLDNTNLKIVAFGTSNTWGAQLQDRSKEAYPLLLSPNTINLAERASSPSYPALCAQSMLKEQNTDEEVDVFILEYVLMIENLDLLARRLRTRFPDALIIVVELWNPRRIIRTDTNQHTKLWVEQSKGYQVEFNGPEFQAVLSETKEEDWKFNIDQERELMINKVVKEVGAVLYKLPREKNALHSMLKHGPVFVSDASHLSAHGHAVVAIGLAKIINSWSFRGRKRLGVWKEGDSCSNWFGNGKVDILHDDNMKLNEFSEGKFALETSMNGNTVHINNPFPNDRMLYVMHMAMGPMLSQYPTTLVTIDNGKEVAPSRELDTSTLILTQNLHVTQVKQIGMVSPGLNSVHFFPLQDLELPFRFTGFAVSFDIGGDIQKLDPNRFDHN